MALTIGIRHENKSVWESRCPLVPGHVAELHGSDGIEFIAQSSPTRAFPDEEFRRAGAAVADDLGEASLVLAVKEIPPHRIEAGKVYAFFAHVIKGQAHNMPMLRALMAGGCTLIDYEKIADESGRRLVFFGRFAGIAGMLETLRALGERLTAKGVANPFAGLLQPRLYASLDEARAALREVAAAIERDGIPEALRPLVVGITGYGNVSLGAQEVLDLLPVIEVEPARVAEPGLAVEGADSAIVKTVFHEEHLVRPKEGAFELQGYYDHPERYEGVFGRYVDRLTVLVNCIYWTERYPRLITKEMVRRMYEPGRRPRLEVIGDISCDIEGSVEVTVRATQPDQPTYVYEVSTGRVLPGVRGAGPVIMAVDNLPCELPRVSSAAFSEALRPFIAAMARADYSVPFADLDLPPEVKRAVIVHRGELTPDYRYIQEFLEKG